MKKILIADQDEGTRKGLKDILSFKFPLIITEDQNEGLEALRTQKDILLAFIGLHDTLGINTTIFNKMNQASPQTILIATGDYKSESHGQEAVRQGAKGYLIKPFHAQEILAIAQKNM